MKKGNFIIITGTDGSGKTTLVNQLKNENLPNYIFLKTPLPPFDKFRDIFTENESRNPNLTFPFFQRALKNDLLYVKQLTESGRNVVMERYIETTWNFYLTSCDYNNCPKDLNLLDKDFPTPDKRIILTAPTSVRLKRCMLRKELDWWENTEFQENFQNMLLSENLPNIVFFDSYQNGKRDLKNLVLLELQKPCYICSQPFISRNFHMKNKFRNR